MSFAIKQVLTSAESLHRRFSGIDPEHPVNVSVSLANVIGIEVPALLAEQVLFGTDPALVVFQVPLSVYYSKVKELEKNDEPDQNNHLHDSGSGAGSQAECRETNPWTESRDRSRGSGRGSNFDDVHESSSDGEDDLDDLQGSD